MPQKSLLPDIQLPDRPVHELLADEIRQHGNEIAMVDANDSSNTMSYADILSQSTMLSAALYVNGLRKGDIVSVVLPNCLQYPVIHLAIWQRGAVCSSVNHLYTEYELHHHLKDSKATVIFTTNEQLQNVINVDGRLGGQIKQIIILQQRSQLVNYNSNKIFTFDKYVEFGRNVKNLPKISIDTKKDLAFLPYSSGTTGLPKGVELTHYAVGNVLHIFKDPRALHLPQKGDATPLFLPMPMLFGFIVLHVSLSMGVKLVIIDKFSKRIFLSSLQRYKVTDINSGRELGPNEHGELWVKSPVVMAGYINRPDATSKTIDSYGWLHTGDIGHYDVDGHYYVVDRLKELIKVKAYQVAPAELEDVLLSHESIDDAMVIGIPDARSGELPRAFVVLNANTTDSHDVIRQNIHAFVNERVVAYKQLNGGIEFVTSIPKSPSGKLLRRIMREHYKESHELARRPSTNISKL